MRKVACKVSSHEPLLIRLVTHLLTANIVGLGSIVDCGAHRGGETCLYAQTAPNRTVHAVEPIPRNVRELKRLATALPNIQPLHGGLGSSDRTVSLSGSQTRSMLTGVDKRPTVANGSTAGTFRIHRLDSLFDGFDGPWAGERLAFGHFDVEGSELDLLQGATAVLRRDRPIFTVEQELGADNGRGAMALLREVELLGFRAHMVPEICGKARDLRNFICVPLERPLTDRLLVRNTVPVNASSFNHKELLRVPIISPSKV